MKKIKLPENIFATKKQLYFFVLMIITGLLFEYRTNTNSKLKTQAPSRIYSHTYSDKANLLKRVQAATGLTSRKYSFTTDKMTKLAPTQATIKNARPESSHITEFESWLKKMFGEGDEKINHPPVVHIFENTSKVDSEELISNENDTSVSMELDGRFSYDVDGGELGFFWELLEHPKNSNVILSNTSEPSLSVTLDQPGRYVFALTVTDSLHAQTTGTIDVISGQTSQKPIAIISGPQNGNLGRTIQLSGENSVAPNAMQLSFYWRLIKQPDEANLPLTQSGDSLIEFVPEVAGDYDFELTVTTPLGQSSTSLWKFSALSAIGKAISPKIQNEYVVQVGDNVLLKKDQSYENLNWNWDFTFKPGASSTSLQPLVGGTQFKADAPGTYLIKVHVKDSTNEIYSTTIKVLAYLNISQARTSLKKINDVSSASAQNIPNVSNIPKKLDKIFAIIHVEEKACASESSPIILDGRKSRLTDIHGRSNNSLLYRWRLLKTPNEANAKIISSNQPLARLYAVTSGIYEVELTVKDELRQIESKAKTSLLVFPSKLSFPIKESAWPEAILVSTTNEDFGYKLFYANQPDPTLYRESKVRTKKFVFNNLVKGLGYKIAIHAVLLTPSATSKVDSADTIRSSKINIIKEIEIRIPHNHHGEFFYWYESPNRDFQFALSEETKATYPSITFQVMSQKRHEDQISPGSDVYKVTQAEWASGLRTFDVHNFNRNSRRHFVRFQSYHQFAGDLFDYDESPAFEFKSHSLNGLVCFEYIGKAKSELNLDNNAKTL